MEGRQIVSMDQEIYVHGPPKRAKHPYGKSPDGRVPNPMSLKCGQQCL
jgi:hypothetical protein